MSFIKLKESINSFVQLSEQSWDKIQSYFQTKEFKKGDFFVEEGQVCKYVAFSIEGIFREYFYHDGIDKTTDFYFPGIFFSSYISFINQSPSKVYIQALTNSSALVMNYSEKQSLFEKVPEWERLARKITEAHYQEKEARSNMLASMTAKEKYQNLLTSGNPEIIKNIPQQFIASYLGITPETLSRIRKRIGN